MSLNKTCRLCYSCGWNACSERAVWQNDLLQFAHECPVFSNRISSHYTWLGDNNYHFQANVTKLITVYRAVKLQKLNMKTKTRGQISSIRCQEEKALCCCYDTSFFSCLYDFPPFIFSLFFIRRTAITLEHRRKHSAANW